MKKVLLLLSFVTYYVSMAQTPSFTTLTSYYNSEKNFNGAVLVAKNGGIIYLEGIGISSRQSNTTINSKTKFKIASITKTFTAVLTLQLMEQGKIALNETIGTYLKDYKGEGKNKVSIENLLTYSSGIHNCEEYIADAIYDKPISQDDFIAQYCSGKLETVPGSKFNYDNGAYIILGKIIESVTGKSFQENIKERLLNPLGMKNTEMLYSRDIISGLAPCYTFDQSTKKFSADKPYYIENYFAAGALYSTVEDLLLFDQGIFTYKILKKQTVDLMVTPHPLLDNVALGFWNASQYGALNSPFVYRPGGIWGATANWIHVIDSNTTIIVLSNTDATNLFEMSQDLYAVATNQKINITTNQKSEVKTELNTENAVGKWEIDLRPTPNSEAYFKEFSITGVKGKNFSAVFYGSDFSTGKFNTDWDKIYFAFSTSDKENTYFHSGWIEGDRISGISYSATRDFISHWTGRKTKD